NMPVFGRARCALLGARVWSRAMRAPARGGPQLVDQAFDRRRDAETRRLAHTVPDCGIRVGESARRGSEAQRDRQDVEIVMAEAVPERLPALERDGRGRQASLAPVENGGFVRKLRE